jgi:hypothetical protein
MADRTSACLLAEVFKLLAKYGAQEHKDVALEIWGHCARHDFAPYQMDCEPALEKLGLARKHIDPADGYEVWSYGPEKDGRA